MAIYHVSVVCFLKIIIPRIKEINSSEKIWNELMYIHSLVAEFRHNKIVSSPPEINFNTGRQLQRKPRSPELHYIRFLSLQEAVLSLLVTTAFHSILA